MKTAKKAIIIFAIIAGIFGFSQYASASQIGVTIAKNELLEQNGNEATYNMQVEFNNPSLLVLTAGKTDFVISVEDEKIGDGVLEPFVLPAMSKALVDGIYKSDKKYSDSENTPLVKISGVTKYDVLFTSLDVPFVYYPTEDQAREFIQQN
ncbi:MAG TPA: hypothetical protein VD689_03405 [Nitrosopumilaceae archaeon]|nr:hypothetical protein [Nitrosopumilaceae archaeon]